MKRYALYISSLVIAILIGFLLAFGSEILQNGAGGSTSASGSFALAAPYFTDGTNFFIWPGYQVTRPVFANYAFQNQGSATATNGANNSIYLTFPSVGSTNLALFGKSPPGSTWTIDVALLNYIPDSSGALVGLGLNNSVSNRQEFICAEWSNHSQFIQTLQFSSFSSLNSAVSTIQGTIAIPQFLRLNFDGTNYNYSFSIDGVNWQLAISILASNWITTPTQVGIYLDGINTSATTTTQLLSWFQH